ncbi:hypothetical protein B0H14DRAFT_2342110 [Mycena olivaceomarginata]|nr:hypothetical protein B0H14DRAFT_2342110 [Mycena olivaceomarginata]
MPPESEKTTSDASQTVRNSKYYLDDPMTIFLVGNRLFKVHRHFLVKESEVFHWMFACPSGSSGPDGFSDDRAIPLLGVTPVEFGALLDYFYEEKFQRHRAAMQEWIDLLAISTRFDFQRIREDAIDAIEHSRWPPISPLGWRKQTIDPIDQIVLAEKNDIRHWLPIAYALICERGNSLEEWEAEKLGARKTALLARAREAIRNPHHEPPAVPVLTPPSESGTVHTSSEFSSRPETPNGFHHNRARVKAIVSEVFFPAPHITPQSSG